LINYSFTLRGYNRPRHNPYLKYLSFLVISNILFFIRNDTITCRHTTPASFKWHFNEMTLRIITQNYAIINPRQKGKKVIRLGIWVLKGFRHTKNDKKLLLPHFGAGIHFFTSFSFYYNLILSTLLTYCSLPFSLTLLSFNYFHILNGFRFIRKNKKTMKSHI